MEISVSVHEWLKLPMTIRVKMREIFGINKSQGSLVEGNVVKSDGTTYQDLQEITVEKMQRYLADGDILIDNNPSDFVTLFNACVDKIAEADKELEPVEKLDPTQIILEEWAANLNRMKMQAENQGLSDHFKTLINKLFSYDNARPEAPAPKKPGRPAKAK